MALGAKRPPWRFMAMSTGGLSVATTADLNAALGQMETKFDEQRKWVEGHISDFIIKLRNSAERLDHNEREQTTSLETMSQDLKALRAGVVTNAVFRQQNSGYEQRFDHEKEEVAAKLDHLKMSLEKEITTNISNLRLKAETLNANCIVLTEKSKVLEETLIPAVKAEIEEQKQKRLCETQRLESECEKVKEVCEQKISHTAAALRFYVTATATKLREELAPMTLTKELEEDIKQKDADLRKMIKSVEDITALNREAVAKHRNDVEVAVEKHASQLGQHTKSLKVVEITLTNLQSGCANDLNEMRTEMASDRAKLQVEVSDARANAIRASQNNDSAIQQLAAEINPLRQFRELILERLHIEKFVNQVREWQTSHIPQVTSAVKDLEERARKLLAHQVRDHEVLCELQKSTSEIRRHFKMFHAIAAGLDDKPHPALPDPMAGSGLSHSGGSVAATEDTRLPPIQSARGGVGQLTP